MAQRKIRRRSGQPRERITAQHVDRLDIDGNPQIKVFTREAWDAIPERHYYDSEGKHRYAKSGWIIATDKSIAVPKRLKEVKPKSEKKGKKSSPQTGETINEIPVTETTTVTE